MIEIRPLDPNERRIEVALPEAAAREIIERVRKEGDAAVRELTLKFDGHEPAELKPAPVDIPDALRRSHCAGSNRQHG